MSRTYRKGFEFVKELTNESPRVRYGDHKKGYFNNPHSYKETYHSAMRGSLRRQLQKVKLDTEYEVLTPKQENRNPQYDW